LKGCGMSKGSWYRLVDKKKYDRNYLRLYGMRCSCCENTEKRHSCPACGGLGYVVKPTR